MRPKPAEQITVTYQTGETEVFQGPVEIIVSTRGLVSLTERNGEITHRYWHTMREIGEAA